MCLCLSLCLSHSVSFSLTQAHKHTSPCVCVCITCVHTNISTHRRMRAYTEVHTHLRHAHPHTHTSTLQLSEALCAAYACVCPYAHCSVCVCAYTGVSRYIDKHSLSSQQRLYAAVILPYKSGIPPFLPSACYSETFTLPSRSLSRAAELASFPEVVRMANGIVRSSHSRSFLWHFSLDVGYSLLFVVDWAGCGWGFFFLS